MKIKQAVWNRKKALLLASGLAMLAAADVGLAAGNTIGNMATNILATFKSIGLMITAGSYIGGLAFSIGAVMKFKQHKEAPTQVPLGQPMTLLLLGASLLFMPTLMKTLGSTMFGTASSAGPTGVTITST